MLIFCYGDLQDFLTIFVFLESENNRILLVLSYGGIKRLSNGIGVSYSPVSTHDFDSCSTSSNLVAPTILNKCVFLFNISLYLYIKYTTV